MERRSAISAAKHSRFARRALLLVDDLTYGRIPVYPTKALGHTYPMPKGCAGCGGRAASAMEM